MPGAWECDLLLFLWAWTGWVRMDKKEEQSNFWYAVDNTEIVHLPRQRLETFGSTVLSYHLVSELMDSANKVKIREGTLKAGRPEIITPAAYSQRILDGFGEQAEEFLEWFLRHNPQQARILRYGFRIEKQELREHVVTDNVRAVVERVRADVAGRNDPMCAVVLGVEDPWDVCLLKLFATVMMRSAEGNVMEMEQRNLFEDTVREEIEDGFRAARRDRSQLKALADRLKFYHRFEEYEDRFFALVKSLGG